MTPIRWNSDVPFTSPVDGRKKGVRTVVADVVAESDRFIDQPRIFRVVITKTSGDGQVLTGCIQRVSEDYLLKQKVERQVWVSEKARKSLCAEIGLAPVDKGRQQGAAQAI